MTVGRSVVVWAAIVLCALLVPSTAWGAATIQVTTESDALSPTDGECSLREATLAANSDSASGGVAGECVAGSGADTIELPAGSYTLSIAPVGSDDGTSGDLNLATDISLQGAGSGDTIIDANHIDRVMTVGTFGTDVTVAIDGVTITGGRAPDGGALLDGGDGGGIVNRADLTLSASVVTDNASGNGADAVCENCAAGSGGSGGGIQNLGWREPFPPADHGSLTVRDSTISANFTGDGGDSSGPTGFAGAGGQGGGLLSVASLTVVNSTIVGNRTGSTGTAANVTPGPQGGGGVISGFDSSFTNVTIVGNQTGAVGTGGGVVQGNFALTLTNTIIANNDAPNCAGTIDDAGGNLAFPLADSSCPAGFNRGDPLLGALGDHGGETATLVPSEGSAALDAAQAADCPGTDQRGVSRPVGTGCDIGAVERAVPVATTGAASDVGQTLATLAGSVANPGAVGLAWFEYGTTTAYGVESASQAIPAGSSIATVVALVGPLAAGTSYHYRLVATGPDGTSAGADRSFTTAPAPAAPAAPAPAASELTLTTRRIVVIKRRTRSLRVTCTLDKPTLNTCALTLRAGPRTLATGQANADPGGAGATITLPIGRRTRRLARRPGGLAATLTATATQTRGEQLQATIAMQLLPSAVVSAPTDGLFETGSAKLPRGGTAYLRRLRELVTGALRITCTGHTDNRGSASSNQRLGRARAKAVCAFLTRSTNIRSRARSQGETNPRAPNTTAKGRARNRYVTVQVRY